MRIDNKGSTLLLTLGVIGVLSILCASYGGRIINDSNLSRKNVYSTQAFWVAEAGIQKAAWDYTQNSCHETVNASTGAACSSCTDCGSGNRRYTGSLSHGSFSVSIDPDTKTYISTGTVSQGGMSAQRKIKVFFGQDTILGHGAFAQGDLEISNGTDVDSYNSNNGTYADTVSTHGNIGTNGTTVSVVDIGNLSNIRGTVSTGPGGTVSYNASKVNITGGISATNDVYLDPVSVPADVQAATYYGSLTVSGTTDLAAGAYSYDTIAIGNSGTLNITGAVKLYLTSTGTALSTGNSTPAIILASGASLTIYTDGKIDLGNKVTITNNNASPKPSQFQIYSRYSGDDGVTIMNKNEFIGVVYAPLTEVHVGNNGQFYGAVVGDEVSIGNGGNFHYDEALSSLKAPWQSADPRDWQEVFD